MSISAKNICRCALVLLVLGFSGTKANAQFGVKAGTYTTNFNKLKDYKLEDNTGYNLGVLYKLQITPMFAVQPELMFVSKNACIKDPNTAQREKFDTQYLQLPVSFQYGLNLMVIRPFFQFVPYLTYAIDKDFTIHDDWSGMNRLNGGIGVGGGLDVWKLQLSLRYNWDFVRSGKNRESADPLYRQYRLSKGRALECSIAYIF